MLNRFIKKAGYRIAPLLDWDVLNLKLFEGGADDDISLMSRIEHEQRCRGKTTEGWRYSPEKDPDRKTNHSILTW